MSFPHSSALITGGGRGLGAALARRLAARAVRVVLVARSAAELDAVVAGIRRAGGEAHALVADVADKQAVYPIVGAANALVGGVDLLVHNAATLGPPALRLLLDTECEDVERAFAVNVLGPLRLTRAIAGGMLVRGRGTVLAVSSDAAVESYPEWGAYGLSKAALEHMMRTFAAELAGSGVRFLTVDPGEMDTRLHAQALPAADPRTLLDPEVAAARIVARLEHGGEDGGGRWIAAAS
jgi:NAD(P)-dependent dehydrogenase (short-subunit alcohol dehydrogenase family)